MATTLSIFKDVHKNQKAYISCNGPSLSDVDFSKINGNIIFALNRGYLKEDMLYTYLVTADKRIEKEFAEEIKQQQGIKFCNRIKGNSPDIFQYKMKGGRFSTDITEGIMLGHSVTIVALQIAYYMGCNPVYIIGMNHYMDYSHSSKHEMEFINDEADINHFTDNYYPEDYKFRYQNLKAVEVSYFKAHKAYKKDERELYNASSITELSEKAIPRIDFDETWQPQ